MNFFSQLLATTKFIAQHPLSRHHKISTLINFVKWQIAIRILKKKVVVPWVDDSIFICGSGESGLTGNLYVGFMEYEDMMFLLHALQPTETFIDVGANVGAYTILASKVVHSKSIAFEPLLNTVERLKDQIQINRVADAVDIRNIGIGNKEGFLFFTNNNDTINKVSIAGEVENTTIVKVNTLDRELPKDRQYFFKIDVEGFEYHVIEGASSVLSRNIVSAIIIELNSSGVDFGYSNEDIHKKLLGFGFVAVSYDPKERKLSKLNGFNKKGGNTIYVRDVNLISERCKSAPKRIIHTAFGIKL